MVYSKKLSSGDGIIAASKLLAIRFPRIAVPLMSNIVQFAAIQFLAQYEQFFLSSFGPIIIHNEDNGVFADVFEDKIFLIASHPINRNIQTRDPIFFSIDFILIEIFPRLGMIVSRDDIEGFVGDDSSIDASRSATDSSAFYVRDTSHDSEARNGIFLPVMGSGIIMDFIHKG